MAQSPCLASYAALLTDRYSTGRQRLRAGLHSVYERHKTMSMKTVMLTCCWTIPESSTLTVESAQTLLQ